jgi:hypothetical protein
MRLAGSTKGVDSMADTATSTGIESRETANSASKTLVMMQEKCNRCIVLPCTQEVPLSCCAVFVPGGKFLMPDTNNMRDSIQSLESWHFILNLYRINPVIHS